MKQKQSDEEMK
uniref:Uncharacterized protein n=1 Tax=Anguilla anguilla TaxID=7936 RepID=A0A0E9TIB9_ANGAN